MEKNKINEKLKIKPLSSKKLELSFFTFLLGFIDNIGNQSNKENNYPGDPITKLLTNFEEIEEFLDLNEQNIFKFFYFNRNNIKKILYKDDKIVNINFNGIIKNISYYFYLNLLISENPEQVDYSYSIDFIKEINNLQRNINYKIYQKIILSKIIIELIKNYKETDNYNDKKEKSILKQIKKENKDIIEKNINSFNEIGLKLTKEDIISKNSKKLDEIYIKIIIELIKQKKFEDYEYANKILNELDLENIDITKILFDELSKILNSNKNYIKDYMINNVDDLFIGENINFYYTLLKFILKNRIYIYQNSFLLKIRKNIINILKSNSEKLYNLLNDQNEFIININPNLKEKIIYIIKNITDTEYYFEKYINKTKFEKSSKISQSSSRTNTYLSSNIINPFSNETYKNRNTSYKGEDSLFQSHNTNEIIEEIQEAINVHSINEIAENLLNNSSFTFEIKEMKINKVILNNKIIYNKKDKYNEIKKIQIEYGYLKSIIKNLNINSILGKSYNKLITILEDFTNFLSNNITKKNDFKVILNFKRNINDNNEKNNLYNINLQYKIFIQEKERIYGDNDILNIKNLNYAEGFLFLVNELNQNQIEGKDNNNDNNSIYNKNKKTTKEISNSNANSFSINRIPKSNINNLNKFIYNKIALNYENKYEIMKIITVIGDHKKEAEFIKETKNGVLISGAIDEYLFFYNLKEQKNKIIKINPELIQPEKENEKDKEKDKYKFIYALNIYENNSIQNIEEDEKLDLILCTKFGLLSLKINPKDFSSCKQIQLKNEPCSVYFKMENNSYVIAGDNGIFHFNNQNNEDKHKINYNIKGGIKINNNTIAFTSNDILENGKDILFFYDIKEDKIIKEIRDYSFTVSTNSLALMKFGESECNILLCGCKQYLNNYKKNGILIINIYSYAEEFYDSNDFEVYCFCPISYVIENQNNRDIIETDYFLAGGFSNTKNKGMIKLFKLINNEDTNYKTKIKFIQDIVFHSTKVRNNINEKRD